MAQLKIDICTKLSVPCPFEGVGGVVTNYQGPAMLHMFLSFSVLSHVIRL